MTKCSIRRFMPEDFSIKNMKSTMPSTTSLQSTDALGSVVIRVSVNADAGSQDGKLDVTTGSQHGWDEVYWRSWTDLGETTIWYLISCSSRD